MAGVVAALTLLGYAFHLAEDDSPRVNPGAMSTCPAPDCNTCLHQVCASAKHLQLPCNNKGPDFSLCLAVLSSVAAHCDAAIRQSLAPAVEAECSCHALRSCTTTFHSAHPAAYSVTSLLIQLNTNARQACSVNPMLCKLQACTTAHIAQQQTSQRQASALQYRPSTDKQQALQGYTASLQCSEHVLQTMLCQLQACTFCGSTIDLMAPGIHFSI